MDNFNLIKNILFIALAISVLIFVLCRIDVIAAPKLGVLCAFVLLLLSLSGLTEKITELSAWGMSAKLERKIEEANTVLNQLREFAIVTAKQLIMLKVDSNGLVTEDTDIYGSNDAFKSQVIGYLRQMGIPEDRIKEVERVDRDVVLKFYSYAAFRYGRDMIPQTNWQNYDTEYYGSVKRLGRPLTPDEIEGLLTRSQVDLSGFSEHMTDFRHYFQSSEQRRPAVWAKREEWGFGRR